MRRYNILFVNILVILGLMLSGVVVGSSVSAVNGHLQVAPAGDGEQAAASRKAKRERKKDGKKKDRKQGGKKKDGKKGKKDRKKKDRKKNHKQNQGQAVELTTGILPGADTVQPDPDKGPTSAENRYIVVLKSDAGSERAAANDIAADAGGVTPTHVYEYVFPGFAAVIPGDKVDDVRNDPRVEAVVPDGIVHAYAQTLPTGVNRIDADTNDTANINNVDDRVDVDVAVIDTAGNDTHEDLNIHAWGNCTPSHFNGDDDGHGTHVGGTIGALDNDIGVVGVAPGARLWNIKVLVNGGGFDSWIICGLDLVTKYATDQGDGLGDIEVANLSLGGGGTDSDCATNFLDVEHQAYCRAVDAGVTVVVAAGNESDDAANHTPAAYDEVITVSALADSDGLPGGQGDPPRVGEPDDSLALFSNFGADVDIAAPGRDILSTVPGNGYDGTFSGTSMASPHVAGAAALYLADNPGESPATAKAALLAAREDIALAGDPDGINEGVLDVGDEFGASSTSSADSSASAGDSDRVTADTNDEKSSKDKKAKKEKKSKKKAKKGSKTPKSGKKSR
jgi:subtilisin family serine protease